MDLDAVDVMKPLQRVLDEVKSAASELGHSIPEREYITCGGAVYDCPQVTISANQLTTGVAGSDSAGSGLAECTPGWNVALEATIVRKARELPTGPRGTFPPHTHDIEIDALMAMNDAAVLVRAVNTLVGGAEYGEVPTTVSFGEVQGGLTAVIVASSLNLWAVS